MTSLHIAERRDSAVSRTVAGTKRYRVISCVGRILGVLVPNGFYVDLDALRNAGQGAASLMQELDQHNVTDIACDGSAVGHDRLSSALDSFCQRWQTGVKNLANDGNKLSQHLLDTVNTYNEADQRCCDLLSRAFEAVDGG